MKSGLEKHVETLVARYPELSEIRQPILEGMGSCSSPGTAVPRRTASIWPES